MPEGADVEALREAAPRCRGCELWEPATQVVFSAGDVHAKVVLVGSLRHYDASVVLAD